MNLNDARKLANAEMQAYGLSERGWTFDFDNGLRRFGRCAYGPKLISLSRRITELNGYDEVRETILHEIAHALAYIRHGITGHGLIWYTVAREVGSTGERCYSAASVVTPPTRKALRPGDTR